MAWLAGLGLLVQRELFRSPVERLAEAALRVTPDAVFYEVLQNGKHIGYASSTIDTATREIQVRDVFVADLNIGGAVHRASAQSTVSLSRRLALRSFDLFFESDSSPIRVTGSAEGDSVVTYALSVGDQPADTQRVRTGGPILLPTLVPLAVALGTTPKVGATVTVPIFDPTTMAPRNVNITIRAESLFTIADSAMLDSTGGRWVVAHRDTVRAWQLTTESRSVSPGWVDALGRLVQSTQPGGLVLRRTAYELAFENWRIDRQSGEIVASDRDVLETTAIAARAPLGSVRRERMRAQLRDANLDGFDLSGGRQTLNGDVLTVQREGEGELAAGWLLGDSRVSRRFRDYLKAEPLLEADSPVIRATAERILKGTRDPREAARLLTEWVHDSLEKAITISVPSAVQVLRTGRGDCNEHTQLFLALARAAGLPARGAAGLAYVNGKFYYHAWPEVYLNTWVAVDPTFGQMPAGAGHLRFVSGGLGRQTELLRLIGSLRIDILDTR
jgi:hypothetical protein